MNYRISTIFEFLYTVNTKKYGMIDFEENIIIIWILDKSRSVAPDKLEINLVSPKELKFC